jgi:hypothetical protein
MKGISPSSALGLRYLAAFFLSALLGAGFALFVNETHNFMAGKNSKPGIEGTWQGEWHGQPAVEITINLAGDQFSGTAVFRPVRKTQTGSQVLGSSVAVALKDAHFDGKILRFKLADRLVANDSSLEMTFIGTNEAELKYVGCTLSSSNAEIFKMTKTA